MIRMPRDKVNIARWIDFAALAQRVARQSCVAANMYRTLFMRVSFARSPNSGPARYDGDAIDKPVGDPLKWRGSFGTSTTRSLLCPAKDPGAGASLSTIRIALVCFASFQG